MKCSELGKSKAHLDHMNLDNLDKALHDLGMLSAITEARREYLRETKSNVMRINTRYVGQKVKHTTRRPRNCFRPYVLPVRHRTKSENSDAIGGAEPNDACQFKSSIYEPSTSSCCRDTLELKGPAPAKRCQSLENLNLAADASVETAAVSTGAEVSPEMDCVSTRIQKLQVDE